MALSTCPECEKSISDTATTCPNCGYTMNQATISKVTPSELGELKKNPAAGILLFVSGLFSVIIGIPLITIIIGIFLIIGGIILLGLGIGRIGGYYDTKCPNCSKAVNVTKTAKGIKCPTCKKRCYIENGYLKLVQ